MAVCDRCDREMTTAQPCDEEPIRYGPEQFAPVPFGQETRFSQQPSPDARCHDCGVIVDGFHHEGCDIEECPRCHAQLFSCDCDSEFEKLQEESALDGPA